MGRNVTPFHQLKWWIESHNIDLGQYLHHNLLGKRGHYSRPIKSKPPKTPKRPKPNPFSPVSHPEDEPADDEKGYKAPGKNHKVKSKMYGTNNINQNVLLAKRTFKRRRRNRGAKISKKLYKTISKIAWNAARKEDRGNNTYENKVVTFGQIGSDAVAALYAKNEATLDHFSYGKRSDIDAMWTNVDLTYLAGSAVPTLQAGVNVTTLAGVKLPVIYWSMKMTFRNNWNTPVIMHVWKVTPRFATTLDPKTAVNNGLTDQSLPAAIANGPDDVSEYTNWWPGESSLFRDTYRSLSYHKYELHAGDEVSFSCGMGSFTYQPEIYDQDTTNNFLPNISKGFLIKCHGVLGHGADEADDGLVGLTPVRLDYQTIHNYKLGTGEITQSSHILDANDTYNALDAEIMEVDVDDHAADVAPPNP